MPISAIAILLRVFLNFLVKTRSNIDHNFRTPISWKACAEDFPKNIMMLKMIKKFLAKSQVAASAVPEETKTGNKFQASPATAEKRANGLQMRLQQANQP